jgi:hypothetical protein
LLSPQALFAAALILISYASAIGLNILRGNDRIDCGCLGYLAKAPRLKWAMCLRNAVIALIAIMVASADVSIRSLVWMDFVTIACVLAGLSILYASLEATMALPSSGANT